MKKLYVNLLRTFALSLLFFLQAPFVYAQTATSSAFNEYTIDPNYSLYYNFAKYHLFDGQDFFSTGGVYAACPIPTPSDQASLNSQLSSWGFKVEGVANTLDLLQETFATICLLYQSPTYVQLLGAQKNPITISFDLRAGGGGGYTEYLTEGPLVHLYNPRAKATEENRFFLTHELAHVLSSRNTINIQEVFNNNIFSTAPRLSSINCSIQQYIVAEQNECFADAVGLYLVYPEFTAWASIFTEINNYPSGKYKAYYDFVKNNVFGGTDFFAAAPALAQYAQALNNSIQHSCPPPYTTDGRKSIVNKNDIGCLNTLDMKPAPPQSVITTLQLNTQKITKLQCVGFVEAVTVGVGADIGSTDASAYAGKNIPGYQWIPDTASAKILPGDIMVWGLGNDGCQHIAIVTQTSGNDGLTIAEANGWDGDVTIVPSSRSHEESWCPLKGWLRKQ